MSLQNRNALNLGAYLLHEEEVGMPSFLSFSQLAINHHWTERQFSGQPKDVSFGKSCFKKLRQDEKNIAMLARGLLEAIRGGW